jgi:hypothetical protein
MIRNLACRKCGKNFTAKFIRWYCHDPCTTRADYPKKRCDYCNKVFSAPRKDQVFCSPECRETSTGKKNKIRNKNKTCIEDNCNEKTSGVRCLRCSQQARRVQHEGIDGYTRNTDKHGYIVLHVGKFSPYTNARNIAEHRYVMMMYLGRNLSPEETVHHKNGVRDDNRLENLELWTGDHQPGVRVADHIEHMIDLYRADIEAALARRLGV